MHNSIMAKHWHSFNNSLKAFCKQNYLRMQSGRVYHIRVNKYTQSGSALWACSKTKMYFFFLRKCCIWRFGCSHIRCAKIFMLLMHVVCNQIQRIDDDKIFMKSVIYAKQYLSLFIGRRVFH